MAEEASLDSATVVLPGLRLCSRVLREPSFIDMGPDSVLEYKCQESNSYRGHKHSGVLHLRNYSSCATVLFH